MSKVEGVKIFSFKTIICMVYRTEKPRVAAYNKLPLNALCKYLSQVKHLRCPLVVMKKNNKQNLLPLKAI